MSLSTGAGSGVVAAPSWSNLVSLTYAKTPDKYTWEHDQILGSAGRDWGEPSLFPLETGRDFCSTCVCGQPCGNVAVHYAPGSWASRPVGINARHRPRAREKNSEIARQGMMLWRFQTLLRKPRVQQHGGGTLYVGS